MMQALIGRHGARCSAALGRKASSSFSSAARTRVPRELAVVASHGSLTEHQDSARASSAWIAAAAGATAAMAMTIANDDANSAHCDASAGAVQLPLSGSSLSDDSTTSKSRSRRQHLKSRSRHRAKLDDVDLMKIHLDEYRQSHASINSLTDRFELYASQRLPSEATTTNSEGESESADGVPVMTFTDFVHSLILPRFHTASPHPDVEYKCDFVGNDQGLITFQECFLLLHLLQIPKEQFDVAFCMFDLDGNGTVDKEEYTHVIENLLHTINSKDGKSDGQAAFSAEATLPRLTLFLFGRSGKKKIRAADLEAALDQLRQIILRAEFDLYARPHPDAKRKNEQVISVHDFAITLLSCFDPDRLPEYFERVEALNASTELVTWQDFYNFHFHVQSNLQDIKLAFELTDAEEISVSDFIRAARVVSGVELSFPVVQLAFRVFDSNDNGTLDQSELLKVLELRSNVELSQGHRSGSPIKRFWQCVKGRVA